MKRALENKSQTDVMRYLKGINTVKDGFVEDTYPEKEYSICWDVRTFESCLEFYITDRPGFL